MADCIKSFAPLKFNEPSRHRRESTKWYKRAAWRRVREQKLKKSPLCESCGTHEDLHVHHVKPRRTHPQLAYELNNLKTLCRRCHSRIEMTDRVG